MVQNRAKQIPESHDSTSTFKFSEGCFTNLKHHYKESLRRPTNAAQNSPDDKEGVIQEFHKQISKIQLPSEGDVHKKSSVNFTRQQMLTKPHFVFPLPKVQPTRQQIPPQSGFVVDSL